MKIKSASDEEFNKTVELLPEHARPEVEALWNTLAKELERPLTMNEKLCLFDMMIITTALIAQAPQLVSSMRVLITSIARIMAYPAVERTMAKDIPDKLPDF